METFEEMLLKLREAKDEWVEAEAAVIRLVSVEVLEGAQRELALTAMKRRDMLKDQHDQIYQAVLQRRLGDR